MNRIKKVASRLRLPSSRRTSQEGQRNVTPPRSSEPNDPFTTPPHAAPGSSPDSTPAEPGITTPGTPLVDNPAVESRLRLPWTKAPRNPPSLPVPTAATEVHVISELIEPGIMGADLTLPIFDGLSLDPKDHLIDLETDSMERCVDVRVYFWQVGDMVRTMDEDPDSESQLDFESPDDPESRLEYDSKLVREGREHLRDCMAKGEGYFISSHRHPDIIASNKPGSPWYRLPVIGIAADLGGRLEAVASEGIFFDSWKCDTNIGDLYMTNIRIPVLWERMLKPGVLPGTDGFDDTVGTLYRSGRHPALRASLGFSPDEVISDMLMNLARLEPQFPCDPSLAYTILEESWPGLFASDMQDNSPEKQADAEAVARLRGQMSTLDEFVNVKKGYRRKSFLGISFR